MNKIKIYFVLGISLLFLTRCDKFLDLEPSDGLTYSNYWKTKEEVNAVVMAMYESMMTGSSTTYEVVELAFLWGEIRADMIAAGTKVKAEENDVFNGYITADLDVCDWTPVYNTINLCNTIIDCAPAVLEKDETFTQTALNGYLSEAYAVRALMYFYLVRTFGEVPLKLDATLTDDVNLSIAKSPASVIFNQISADLATAESLSVTDYGTTAENKGRVTQYAINAMQADVYLWKEKYDSSVIACNKVINSGQYGLISTYRNLFFSGQTNESIFELVFDDQLLNPFYTMLNTSTGLRFKAADLVVTDIYTIDDENADNYDYRGNYASYKSAGSYYSIYKYLGKTASSYRDEAESYAPWIFYRYADVLLMKAEAEAQLGETTDPAVIIRQIRDRGNALEATSEDTTSSSGLATYILDERAREFAFEGKRWFDLLRNAKRNNYERIDILLNMIVNIAPTERQTTMYNNIKDTLSHYLPIYTNNLQTDDALVQNTFYESN